MRRIYKYVILTFAFIILSGCSQKNEDTTAASETKKKIISETIISESEFTETDIFTDISSAKEKTESTADDTAINISDEQQRLTQLIIEAANAKDSAAYENGTIQSPLFGDFDGDGIKELIAVYGDISMALFDDSCCGEVWFASGDNAEVLISGSYAASWLSPEIICADGHVFLKNEMIFASSSSSMYHEIVESRPFDCHINGYAEQGLRPMGDSGDFTAVHSTYDMLSDGTGHTWKTYWYFFSADDRTFRLYEGTLISENELLEYEGAEEIIDKARSEGKSISDIYIRDNGIININLTYDLSENDINSDPCYAYSFYTLQIGGNAVTDITPEYNEGYYLP